MSTIKRVSRKPHPPFFTSTKRFATIGLHPALDQSGSQRKKITEAGPGTYDLSFHACKFKNGFLWKLQEETEIFSKYQKLNDPQRKLQRTLGGPGTNDVNNNLFKKQHHSKFNDISFGRSERFNERFPNLPASNTYFRKVENQSTLRTQRLTNTPTFEFDGFIERFPSRTLSYSLPPNLYNTTKCDGKNTADIIKKVVSARGPFDTFTGPRDETTIKNYFAPASFKPPEHYYVKPSSLDTLLFHPTKRNMGKFLKQKRFNKTPTLRHMLNDTSLCYRNPLDPGPAHYYTEYYGSIQQKPPTLYPFDTSKANARPPPARWSIFPGPGRYTPKAPKCMKQKRQSWIFLSNVNRNLYTVNEYSSF